MSDSMPPKPSQPAYLPRTWKAEPEPVEEPKPTKSGKAKGAKAEDESTSPVKKKKKKVDADRDDGTGASKLEETPLLDTYETRQRVRYAIGGVLSLIMLVVVVVLYRTFASSPPTETPAPDRKENRVVVDAKESAEREAAALVDNARQADRLGRTAAALDLLKRVVRSYEGTEAARFALGALDRERRNRPLFEVETAKNAAGPAAPRATQPSQPQPTGPNPPPTIAAAPTGPAPPSTNASTSKPAEVMTRSLPSGFKPDPTAPIHPSGWPKRIVCDRDGAGMVLVPGEEFAMGRDDGDSEERPEHRVKVSTFYIDEHEVTNKQYQFYLKDTGRPDEPIPGGQLDLPVTGLTARNALAYCKWANRRLPTEAQWEFAARSADGKVSYGLNKEPGKGDAATDRTLEPVMSNPTDRSPFGAFDLAGNAWEWTGDYYDSKYYYALRGLTSDPLGPAQSRIKPAEATVKGGSRPGYLTWRAGVRIDGKLPYLGFRGAVPADLPVAPAPVAQPNQPGSSPPLGGSIPF